MLPPYGKRNLQKYSLKRLYIWNIELLLDIQIVVSAGHFSFPDCLGIVWNMPFIYQVSSSQIDEDRIPSEQTVGCNAYR